MSPRTRIAAVLTAGAVLLAGGVAHADPISDLQQQREENSVEQERLASELEGTDASLQSVYLELARIEGEIPIAQATLEQAQEDLAAAERHQTSVDDRLTVAETEATTLEGEIELSAEQITTTEDGIGELARSSYRGSEGLTALRVVLDAGSPEEFASRTSAVSTAMRSQGQVLDDLQTTAANQRNSQVRLDAVNVRIGELKVEADAAVVAADDARETAQDARDDLDTLKADQETQAGTLETRKDEIAGQQALIDADNATLDAEIQRLVKEQEEERKRQLAALEEQRKKDEAARKAAEEEAARSNQPAPAPAPAPAPQPGGGSGGGAGGGGGSAGGGNTRPGSFGLIPPIPTPFHVTSKFGYRTSPFTGNRVDHWGTDMRSACGNPQWAAGNGTVIATKRAAGNGTHGNQVLIDHGVIDGRSVTSVYNHLSKFNVVAGQRINQGEVLGYTGMTGKVTGCHVHVEVWLDGKRIDPESLPGWTRSN